jgi:hypothetical protein
MADDTLVGQAVGFVKGAVSWPVGFFDSDPTGTPPPQTFPAPWRRRLQPASFRGVPFFVDEANGEGGRRWAHFEYPGRDVPFSEDLGRAQRKYAVRGYTLGDDYMGTRDRLLAACEAAGPGTLVHPYLGHVTVCLDAYRTREGSDEGGICRFDLAFVESSETAAPDPIEAPGAAMGTTAAGLLTSAGDWFTKAWQATGLQDFVSLSALKDLGSLGDVLGWMGVPGLGTSQIASMLRLLPADLSPASIIQFVEQGTSLVAGAKPVAQAITLLGVLGRLRFPITADARQVAAGQKAGPTPALALGRRFATLAVPRDVAPPVPPTPARAQEAANAAALTGLVNQTALAGLVEPIRTVPLTSYADLDALRLWVVDLFDDVELDASADVCRTLARLRASVCRELSRRGANLRPLRTYTTNVSTPAPVLAQRLYQDSSRDMELVARTHAVHPGFLPLSGVVAAL